MRCVRVCVGIVVLSFFLGGCASVGKVPTVRKLAINGITPALEDVVSTTLHNDDLEGVETMINTLLPLIDGLLAFSPDNKDFLTLAAEAYALYAFGFVEDVDKDRAIKLYAKGRDYGIRALKQNKEFKKALDEGKTYSQAAQYLTKEDNPALFYATFAWAFWAIHNVGQGNLKPTMDLPQILDLMERSKNLDNKFFCGGPHLFFGVYNAAVGELLGGGPEKAAPEFKKAFRIENNFLPTHFFYALYYATSVMDEELFDKELAFVLETPNDALPDWALANAVAKKKAKKLLAEKDDYPWLAIDEAGSSPEEM